MPVCGAGFAFVAHGTSDRSYNEFRGARDTVYRVGRDAVGNHPSASSLLNRPPARTSCGDTCLSAPGPSRLVPTVLWQRENGTLVERVDLIARLACTPGAARVEAVIAGRRYERSAPDGCLFGDLVFPLQVPDLGAGADAPLRSSSAGMRLENSTRLIPARQCDDVVDDHVRGEIPLTDAGAFGFGQHLTHFLEREELRDHAETDVVGDAAPGRQGRNGTGISWGLLPQTEQYRNALT